MTVAAPAHPPPPPPLPALARRPPAARVAGRRALEALGRARRATRSWPPRRPPPGKTTFGLHVAHRMLSRGARRRASSSSRRPRTSAASGRADAARYGIDLEPNRPNTDGPGAARPPRRRASPTQTVAAGPARAPRAARRAADAADRRRAAPHGRAGRLGATRRRGVRRRASFRLLLSGTPFRSDNTPIPWVAYDDDGVSRADYDYGYTQALHRPRLPPGHLPHLRRRHGVDVATAAAGTRTSTSCCPPPEAARRLRTALDPDGDWITHVLRDADRAAVGAPRRRAPGRRRARDRDRQGARRTGSPARLGADHGRAAGRRAPPTPRTPRRGSRASRRVARAVARVGADGLRGRRHPAPARRRLRHAPRARSCSSARSSGASSAARRAPSEQMSYVFLPSDPRLKQLAVEIEEERNHALVARGSAGGRGAAERGERGEREDAAFHALSSSARRDDDVLQTTQPGDALRLFGGPPAPPPAPGRVRRRRAARPPAPSRPERRRRPTSSASACARSARRWSARSSRRTGEPHRAIHARVNRDVGRGVGRQGHRRRSSRRATPAREGAGARGERLTAGEPASPTGPRARSRCCPRRATARTRSPSPTAVRVGAPARSIVALGRRRDRAAPACARTRAVALTVMAGADLAVHRCTAARPSCSDDVAGTVGGAPRGRARCRTTCSRTSRSRPAVTWRWTDAGGRRPRRRGARRAQAPVEDA